jgi:hypothetical protein
MNHSHSFHSLADSSEITPSEFGHRVYRLKMERGWTQEMPPVTDAQSAVKVGVVYLIK